MASDYIGSCCGAVQTHVRAMAKALGKIASAEREWKNPEGRAMSAYEYYSHTERESLRDVRGAPPAGDA